jgi:phosphatidylglycerophosphate synthase
MRIIKELTSTVANWISLSRLVLAVPLWIWAVQGRFQLVGWGLVYTGISDILDGLAARVFQQTSEIGEKVDSWTDHLILVSAAFWMVFYRSEILPPGRVWWLVPPAALYLAQLVIGLVKHGRFAAGHLLEGKLLPVMAYIMIVLAMFGTYSETIYLITLASCILSGIVNITFHYRPELFNKHQRSLILGLLGLDFEEGPIRYFFS